MRSEANNNLHPDPRISQEGGVGNPWIGKVHVLRVTPTNKPGNVRAFVDVGIGSNPKQLALTICGCKVVQQPNQQAWVAMPDRQVDGGRWFPIVRVDNKQLEQTIRSAVLAAWRENVIVERAEQTGDGGRA